MNRKITFAVTGLALLVLGVGIMTAQDKTKADPKREADKLAIEKLTKEMVQAFDKRDAAAVAAHYTTEAEFIRNDGEPIRGKAEIEKAYAAYFKTIKGKTKLEVQSDNLRFPSADSAVAEVTLRLKNEEGEVIASSWRN